MKGIAELPTPYFALRPISLSSSDQQGGARWIQLAIAGNDWTHRSLGPVPITTDDLRTMHANFEAGHWPQKGTAAPIDYEHLSTQPAEKRKPGDGEAAGWIQRLELREGDTELWGLVDWTDDAAARIKSKKYRYFSPTFHRNWPAHGNKHVGPVLFGGALTNYPTLPLLPVECSALSQEFASAEDIPLSDRERRVIQALEQKFPPTVKDGAIDWGSNVWARHVFDDRVVFSRSGKDFEIRYRFDDDLTVSFEGAPYEVIVSSTPVVSLSSEVPTMKLKDAKGNEIEVPADALKLLTLDQLAEIPAVASLRQRVETAPKPDDLKKLTEDLQTLSSMVNTQKEEADRQKVELSSLREENDKLKARETEAKIDGLIAKGKILPAEKEEFVSLSSEAPATFERMMAKRAAAEPLVKLDSSYGSNERRSVQGSGGTGGGASAVKDFDLKCREYAKEHKVTYADAVRTLGREFKELAQAAKDEETLVISALD